MHYPSTLNMHLCHLKTSKKSLSPLKYQLKVQKSHLNLISWKAQISSSKSSKLDLDKALGIIHPGAKFFSICGPRKWEDKLSLSEIHGEKRMGVSTKIPIQNKIKWMEKNESLVLSIIKIKLCQLGSMPVSRWYSSVHRAHGSTLRVILFLLWKVACVSGWVVLPTLLSLDFWGTTAFFHSTFLVLLGPKWQCFCWLKILKNSVGVQCMTEEFTPLDRSSLHSIFLNNFISIFIFYWDGWGGFIQHILGWFKYRILWLNTLIF